MGARICCADSGNPLCLSSVSTDTIWAMLDLTHTFVDNSSAWTRGKKRADRRARLLPPDLSRVGAEMELVWRIAEAAKRAHSENQAVESTFMATAAIGPSGRAGEAA